MTNRHRQARLLHYHILARGLLIAAILAFTGYTCATPPADGQGTPPAPASTEVQPGERAP